MIKGDASVLAVAAASCVAKVTRGGGPFNDPRDQGFVTGLFLANNPNEKRDAEAQQAQLNEYADWIRLGLAGNLAEYELANAQGEDVPGSLISYNGSPAGYTADPQENIVYVSAHDNQTLFDAIQAKVESLDQVASSAVVIYPVVLPDRLELLLDDLDELLARREALRHLLPHGALAHPLDERLDHRQRDVGLEQRSAHLAQGVLDVLFGQARLTPDRLERLRQTLAEILEHWPLQWRWPEYGQRLYAL